jgi:hypothetical protein
MRLFEIARPDSLSGAVAVLQKAGYEPLDEPGSYGAVFAKPGSSEALKLYDRYDEAYTAFVTLALKHQDNPHFPKFRRGILPITNAYAAVRIERLAPLAGAQLEDLAEVVCNFAVYTRYDRRAGHKPDNLKAKLAQTTAVLFDHPKLFEAVQLIDAMVETHGFQLDYRFQNIMLRGATLVIIDPIKNRRAS